MNIVVYTKKDCRPCDATKRALTRRGLAFREVSLDDDPGAVELVKRMGFSQSPVVVAGSDSWSGFRPDKIKGLALS